MKKEEIIEYISNMSVLELSELVKALEEKFGVSAAMPVVSGTIQASASASEEGDKKEEKTTFSIELTNAGNQKIQVIKVLREITTLGLKEAKDVVDAAPKVIKEGVSKEEAEEIKKKLEAAGAQVTIK
jgi:large subunit ribosomal protein L7/L12